MGAIGSFRALDQRVHARDARVVCRTARGLEVGTVVCSMQEGESGSQLGNQLESDGELLRGVGTEDELILDRLERFRDRAFLACSEALAKRSLDATLVDVEHLFDGESLYFYFLGEVDDRLDELTSELAETYERKVRFKKFAETLAAGCGPGCGTTASQCGTGGAGGCGNCELKGSCR